MPNKAAKLVADSLLGVDFKTIFICGKAYTIYPATVKIICRGLSQWAQIGMNLEDQTKISVISQIPANYKPILRGLSYFVTGDVKGYRLKAYKLYLEWTRGTPSALPRDMSLAVYTAIELIQGQDFFDCATSCKNVVKMVANPK